MAGGKESRRGGDSRSAVATGSIERPVVPRQPDALPGIVKSFTSDSTAYASTVSAGDYEISPSVPVDSALKFKA